MLELVDRRRDRLPVRGRLAAPAEDDVRCDLIGERVGIAKAALERMEVGVDQRFG